MTSKLQYNQLLLIIILHSILFTYFKVYPYTPVSGTITDSHTEEVRAAVVKAKHGTNPINAGSWDSAEAANRKRDIVSDPNYLYFWGVCITVPLRSGFRLTNHLFLCWIGGGGVVAGGDTYSFCSHPT